MQNSIFKFITVNGQSTEGYVTDWTYTCKRALAPWVYLHHLSVSFSQGSAGSSSSPRKWKHHKKMSGLTLQGRGDFGFSLTHTFVSFPPPATDSAERTRCCDNMKLSVLCKLGFIFIHLLKLRLTPYNFGAQQHITWTLYVNKDVLLRCFDGVNTCPF